MACSQLTTLLIATVMGTGCHNIESTFKDKPQLLKFATQHPIAAAAIGKEDGSLNITSSAIRFSTRVGLDNSKNGDGRGTEVNALRHSLWQATIAARFNADIATAAGNAYEKNINNRKSTQYTDRYAADEAVDLRNNAIGRKIGIAHHRDNMKQLTVHLLTEYRDHGLWTASSSKINQQTIWTISQTKLPISKYNPAIKQLNNLDEYGMTPQERTKLQK